MTITVDGVEIPEAAVEFEMNRLIRFYSEQMRPEEIDAQRAVLRRRAVDQAIGARLLMDYAEKLQIEPTAADIEARMARMVSEAGGDEAFERALAGQNLTLDRVRDGVRRGRRVDLLVEKITEGVQDPTEEEIGEHFRAHAGEYHRADRVQAQHILIRPASDTESAHREARAQLADIRRRLEGGADFAETAAASSECPSGAKTGGSLGWFSRDAVVPEFGQVAFDLEVGELSGVVQTPLGYHLIRKQGHEDGGPAELPDVADRVRYFLRHVRRGERIAQFVKELRAKTEVSVVDDAEA